MTTGNLFADEHFASFIGGMVEIQNRTEGCLYRGKIAAIALNGCDLDVTMTWCIHAVDAEGCRSSEPVNGWAENESTAYTLTLATAPDAATPHTAATPLVAMQSLSSVHLQITSPTETITLFPPGDEPEPDNISWLPDGPRARAGA